MFYVHLLVFFAAIIFVIADFFTFGKENFKRWEFYVLAFAILGNGASCYLIKNGGMPVFV